MRQASNVALNLARDFEGYELEAYLDPAGIPTIGRGHTRGVVMGQVITPDQVEQFFIDDMNSAATFLNSCMTNQQVNQNQFDALCDFVFNVKHTEFLTSHLLRYVNAGQFDLAAGEFPKWVYAHDKDGNVIKLEGLVKRRAAEQEVFLADV